MARPRSSSGSPGRRLLPSAGLSALILLAVADVVLVGAALDHVKPASPAEDTTAAASAGSPAAPTFSSSPESPGASASASTGARPGARLPEGPLLLAQAADGTLLRATLGGCTDDSDPQVAVSTDQGATFRRLRVAEGLDGVLAVTADGQRSLQVVGADADCTAQLYSGSVRTRIWTAGSSEAAWHLVESGADTVHSPAGIVSTPCTPNVLSTVNAVRLLCSDGAVLGTSDAGDTWATLGRLKDASTLAFDGPSRGYALVSRGSCPVTAMTTDDGGASWTPTACLEGEEGRALAARGDVVTALVDDHVYRSEDGAATWVQVS